MQSRALRPYPPAAVTLNAQSFPTTLSNAGSITVAWKRRNRQNVNIQFSSDADEAPEPGTEYCVVHEGVEENLGNGITGSFRFLADGLHTVEVFARRDGLESTRLSFPVTVNSSPAVPGAPPSIPGTLAATPSSLSNVLNWGAATGGALGYNVYGRQGAGAFGTATLLGSTSGLTFTHRGLSAGAAWRYWVVAYNAAGTSAESNEATATAFSGGSSGTSYSGGGDPVTPQEDGDTYTDTSQEPPVQWVQIGGAWVRQTTYDVSMTWIGLIPSLKVFLKFQAVRGFTLPDNLAGSKFEVDTAPVGGDVAIKIRKTGVDIGVIDIADGSTIPVVTFTDEVRFEDGDDLELYSPLDLHGMRGLFITFAAYR